MLLIYYNMREYKKQLCKIYMLKLNIQNDLQVYKNGTTGILFPCGPVCRDWIITVSHSV